MQKMMTYLLTTILSLLIPCSFVWSDANVQGRVFDVSTNEPLSGILITLQTTPPLSTVTNASGVYKFINVASGKYQLEIEIPENFVAASPSPTTITVGSTTAKVNFSIGKPGSVEGRVIDIKTNEPIREASVDVMRGNNVIATATTDEDGLYSITNLAPRPYLIRVRTPYFQTNVQLVTVSPETPTVMDFSLDCPPGALEGQVMSSLDNEPLKCAFIEIFKNGVIINTVQTNDEGKYRLSDINPGTYLVKVRADRFEVVSQEVSLLNNQIETVNFTLSPFGQIFGQTLHAFTQQPIANVSIGFWQDNELVASCQSDECGFYNISGNGTGALIVQGGDFYSIEQKVHIEYGNQVELNFNLICFEPTPPRNGSCKKVQKSIGHRFYYKHVLKWKTSLDPKVVSYRIFSGQKLLGEVAATKELTFTVECGKGSKKTYKVIAVNAFGQTSNPLIIESK